MSFGFEVMTLLHYNPDICLVLLGFFFKASRILQIFQAKARVDISKCLFKKSSKTLASFSEVEH